MVGLIFTGWASIITHALLRLVGEYVRSSSFKDNLGLAGGGNSKVVPGFASATEVSVEQRSIGMKLMELAEER